MPKEKGGKKNQAETVERITEQKVLPIIERYGYELWDVIFEKEGAMWYLKVLFDKTAQKAFSLCEDEGRKDKGDRA